MLKFENTLSILATQRKNYEDQILAIRRIEAVLSDIRTSSEQTSSAITYEVHFQCSWPGHHPIMTTGNHIGASYEKAVVLWRQYNGHSSGGHGGAEVFLCVGDLFVPLRPAEAALIANSEGEKQFSPNLFDLDKRMIQEVGTTVWKKGQQLGSAWYADSPTAEKHIETAVPA